MAVHSAHEAANSEGGVRDRLHRTPGAGDAGVEERIQHEPGATDHPEQEEGDGAQVVQRVEPVAESAGEREHCGYAARAR